MIKTLFTIIASFLLLCLLLPVLMFSFSATVEPPAPFSPQDISKLKKTFEKSNPFKFQRFKHQSIVFNEHLLNQSTNFALSQTLQSPSPIIAIKIKLTKNIAQTEGSIQLPKIPIPVFLNFSGDISSSPINLIQISNISIGYLPIPDFIAQQFISMAKKYVIKQYPDYIKLLETIKKIDIKKDKLTLNYHWNTQLSKKIKTAGRNFLFPPEQQKLLGIYYKALSDLSRLFFWKPIGLNKIIQPIFLLAKQRTAEGADPIEENKAAILALGIMASGIRVNHLLQDSNAKPFRDAYFFRLSLLKRKDLMQHFLISSALAVSTNTLLSDTIGLSKEMDDSKEGSGFSFADLLADRAGVKLAQVATESSFSARYIQDFLSAKILKQTDFMPPYSKLPESITALEFKRTYVDIHHEKYLFVEQELQRRIISTPLYSNKTTN